MIDLSDNDQGLKTKLDDGNVTPEAKLENRIALDAPELYAMMTAQKNQNETFDMHAVTRIAAQPTLVHHLMNLVKCQKDEAESFAPVLVALVQTQPIVDAAFKCELPSTSTVRLIRALTQHKCPGFYKMLRHLVRSDGALIKKPPSWWRNNPDCSLELAKSIVSFFDSDAVADPDGVDSGHIASTQDVCPTYGLANIGNSCYFNSALQLLFRVYGCAIKNLSNKEPEDSTTVKLLARLVQHVREPGPWGRASKTNDDLHTLLYAVQNLNREARTMFALYRQASSSSVATHILSLIEFASLRLSPPHYFTSVPMETSGDDQWKVFRADHPFEFTQNQCGQLKTEIFCAACKASGFAQPAFSGFSSLSIPASAAHLRNVQDAIFLWGRDGTPLTNMVLERCNHCKATGTWRQRHCISRFPATGVLLVTINREYHDSNGQARKWDDGVTLPATVIFPGERCAEFAVEPVATCVHSGTVEGGHYHCVVAREDGGSTAVNDGLVRTSADPITSTAHGSLYAFQLKQK